MKEEFYKFCKKIDYEAYCKIKDNSLYASLGFAGMGILGAPAVFTLPLEMFLFTVYYVLAFTDGDKYTKNVFEINQLYQEFINNYIKLQNTFHLKNPIEIYSMFTFLLNRGYLSKNRISVFDNMHAYDIKSLFGVDVINGVSVCRHRASMLDDILCASNVDSRVLSVYLRDNVSVLEINDQAKTSWRQIYDWYSGSSSLLDKRALKLMENLLSNYSANDLLPIEFRSEFIDTSDKSEKITGNHMITCCTYENNSYFLDPTQSRIYRVLDKKKKILYDEYDDGVLIRGNDLNIFGAKEKKKILNDCLSLPFVMKDVEDELIEKTLYLCRNNLDIFEIFYKDNSELYSEIGNKLKKVRKK